MRTSTSVSLAVLAGASFAASSRAALVYTTSPAPAGTAFSAGAAIVTNANDPNGANVTGQFVTFTAGTAGTALVQTITPASTFALDHLSFYTTGQGGATGRFGIFAVPSFAGGKDGDGFVNTSFSTNLLGGGSGLNFTSFGSGGTPPTLNTFSLTGTDRITLTAGTVYAVEFEITGGSSFQLLRSVSGNAASNTYAGGADFQGASELNFNGTAPANSRGERDAFAPGTDNLLALYAVPEPTSLCAVAAAGVSLLTRRRRA